MDGPETVERLIKREVPIIVSHPKHMSGRTLEMGEQLRRSRPPGKAEDQGFRLLSLTCYFLYSHDDTLLRDSDKKRIRLSISSSVTLAVNEKRIRDVPTGTVGGRTGRQ